MGHDPHSVFVFLQPFCLPHYRRVRSGPQAKSMKSNACSEYTKSLLSGVKDTSQSGNGQCYRTSGCKLNSYFTSGENVL